MLLRVKFEENDKDLSVDFGEIHTISSSPPLEPATTEKLGGIIVGENLAITKEGVLSVMTTNLAEEDNTRPITSAGVNTIVGNIEVLLKTI